MRMSMNGGNEVVSGARPESATRVRKVRSPCVWSLGGVAEFSGPPGRPGAPPRRGKIKFCTRHLPIRFDHVVQSRQNYLVPNYCKSP
jgi:hypothetical protein